MLQLIEQLHDITNEKKTKLDPEIFFHALCCKISRSKKLFQYNSTDSIKKPPSPTLKKELMRFIGSVNFYSKFIDKLHINMKPLYGLHHDNKKIFNGILNWKHCFSKWKLVLQNMLL